MGVFWFSQAEVVTTKPQTVKKLIEKITQEESVAPVHKLEVKNKSIFFHSNGDGCYGVGWETHQDLLFEKLFERFTEPLVCFEYVIPCQSQRYYFSSRWVKLEGEFDRTDYTSYDKYNYLLLTIGEPSEQPKDGLFDDSSIWYIEIQELKQLKNKLPNLYKAYSKAKKEGFKKWIKMPDKTLVINYEIACELAESYGYDDLFEDCEKHIEEYIKKTAFWFLEDCGLPKRFPKLQLYQS